MATSRQRLERCWLDHLKHVNLSRTGPSGSSTTSVDIALTTAAEGSPRFFRSFQRLNVSIVAVDAHSKWPEVHPVTTTTTAKTDVLRQLFSSYGRPEQTVTSNGPQFTLDDFMKGNGAKHIWTAPYHPASNGLAQRFVQSFEQSLKTTRNDGKPLLYRLSNYLLTYPSSPHATSQQTDLYMF